MPRAVDGSKRKDRRKKVLDITKGYWGRRKNVLRTAKDAAAKAGMYSYRDRKRKKRDFRRIWITRISAACKTEGINYSSFINGLSKANIEINRKVLSNMAIEDPAAFKALVTQARKALGE